MMAYAHRMRMNNGNWSQGTAVSNIWGVKPLRMFSNHEIHEIEEEIGGNSCTTNTPSFSLRLSVYCRDEQDGNRPCSIQRSYYSELPTPIIPLLV